MTETEPGLIKNKITIFGAGYVGLSIALLLSDRNDVNIVELDNKKVDLINQGNCPINDSEISSHFSSKSIHLKAFNKFTDNLKDSHYFIIAISSNYDEKRNAFDTSGITGIVQSVLDINKDATIIIKSTVPIGYTDQLKEKYLSAKIVFIPEFLREDFAFSDQLNPSRIIIGGKKEYGEPFVKLMLESIEFKKVPVLFMASCDAEAAKLFANSYLALRVSFFNELDSFALAKKLNSRDIIDGLSFDPRIGSGYNNPSFGYGGYCLPKDTKQLLSQFNNVPQDIFSAVVDSNASRKAYLISKIEEKKPKHIGIYRLQMKKNSGNYRESAVLDIIQELKRKNYNLTLFEPLFTEKTFEGINLCNEIEEFKLHSDIILANRLDECLDDVKEKVFSRDIFKNN